MFPNQRIYILITVLPFFLVFLHLFLVFPSIPPTFPRELLVFLVSLKSFCFFRCTPAFLEAFRISMVFLMRAPVFLPDPPDKPEAFVVLIPCVRCLHSWVLPFFLVFLQLFLVFSSIPPAFPRELLVFLVSLRSFCFFRCTPAFLEAHLISMVFLMRAPDFSPVPPDKHEAFLVLIPCVRCLHSCSILPVI